MERCPTGIVGLDEITDGGFPRGRTILLSGSCGTGKTTFATQFLCNGVIKYGEPGILVSLEENPNELRTDMQIFGFDMQKLEDERKLSVIDASLSRLGLEDIVPNLLKKPQEQISLFPDEFNMRKILKKIIEQANKINAKRIVIDSLPALDALMKDTYDVRRTIINLNYKLKSRKLTSILISEIPEGLASCSPHGVEEFVVDGVIIMRYISMGTESGRSLFIRKMRGTSHSEDIHPLAFEAGVGVNVLSL